MLRAASLLPVLNCQGLNCRGRLANCCKVLGTFCGVMLSQRIALAEGPARIVPLLAQESSGEGGYPIIEWAIVVVLVGVSLFVICRSSRRN
jgi:hypothetical protein